MTKEKEQALSEAFEAFIDMSFMKTPIDSSASAHIAEDIMGWGTTIDEDISTFLGWKWMINRQIEEANKMNLTFFFERQPHHRRISHRQDSALIIELVNVTISGEGFENKFTFRMTAVLECIDDDSWKVIHWHGSIPTDSENDPWHVNEWKQKNELLEKEVQERTAELKAKNRELEIEAAVEKVRNQALAMQSPDDILSVLEVLNESIHGLNLNDLSPFIWINDGEGWFSQYDISKIDSHGSISNLNFKLYTPNYPHCNRSFSKVAEGVKYFVECYKGDEIVALANEVSEIDKESGKMFHAAIKEGHLPEYQQAVATFKQGAVGLDFNMTPPPAIEGILLKMADAIGLAYQRVEELQESLRRRKEAELEASVERVRARAMGMQTSNDLLIVLQTLHEELQKLDLPNQQSSHIVIEKDQDHVEAFNIGEYNSEEGTTAQAETINIRQLRLFGLLIDGWRTNPNYNVEYVSYAKIVQHGEDMRRIEEYASYADIWESVLKEGKFKELWSVSAGFGEGLLGGDFLVEPDDWVKKVMTKMAGAFGLSYQRFDELQVKEAQAQAILEEKERLFIALKELQATQAQLIQSEKMASLGELTAGIAHEIQNPLNFVNNFSEVSAELVEEMKEELAAGTDASVQFAVEIADDLKQNLEKINHHGKRADAIVKGMLEHSRINKGEKAPTDLNALADEFVRLSYHGLRAKDKNFNADFTLELDPEVPKVNVVASDIGRVLLNLINNAFYAVHEKANSGNIDTNYKPTVSVSSSYSPLTGGQGGVIQLSVQDNGSGIPDSIKEKIFQPFFTTKPTGLGTGLGLSLSYDIVKAHGGELRVESKSDNENDKGTTFFITLPILKN